jgi:hypothetical protein
MNVFLAALHRFCSHVEVRGQTLLLSQGHPFTRIAIDLRQVAAHKLPGPETLRLRLLRGRWQTFSMAGFRPTEIDALIEALERWERENHRKVVVPDR